MTNILLLIVAIHQIETSGRLGPIIGDKGAALGPLQIHRACFLDSKVKGNYSNCADYDFSCKVFLNYCRRYESKALASNNFETLARLWNGGPSWRKNKQSTNKYWQRVKSALD